jgi:hypothetical protein
MNASIARALGAGRRHVSDAGRAIARIGAELLTGVALLVGWLLITAAIAQVVRGPVWKLSFGVLLLSAVGLKFLGRLMWVGLYTSTRDVKAR